MRDTPDAKNTTLGLCSSRLGGRMWKGTPQGHVLCVWVVKGEGRVEGCAGREGVPLKVGGDWRWQARAGFDVFGGCELLGVASKLVK